METPKVTLYEDYEGSSLFKSLLDKLTSLEERISSIENSILDLDRRVYIQSMSAGDVVVEDLRNDIQNAEKRILHHTKKTKSEMIAAVQIEMELIRIFLTSRTLMKSDLVFPGDP